MNCPLCNEHLLSGGPTLYRVWMEMENDNQFLVGVHLRCAWEAIRDKLYDESREGNATPSNWVGWEPMTPLGESRL